MLSRVLHALHLAPPDNSKEDGRAEAALRRRRRQRMLAGSNLHRGHHGAVALFMALVVAPLVLPARLLGQPKSDSKPAPPPAVVSGQVLDQAGQALTSAKVELHEPGTTFEVERRLATGERSTPTAATGTDHEGRFALTAPRTGLWLLEVHADGYLSELIELFPLMQSEELLPITLVQVDSGVTVRVLDEEGMPISGATVDLEFVAPPLRTNRLAGPQSARAPGQTLQQRSATNARGAVRLEHASGRNYDLRIDHPGFVPLTLRNIDSKETTHEIQLSRGRTVTVCVRHYDGPSKGSKAPGSVVTFNPRIVRLTDEHGCLQLHLGDRHRLASYAADGSQGAYVYTATVEANSDPEIEIELLAPRTLRGTVRRAAGSAGLSRESEATPLPAATIWVDAGNPVGSDARGQYEIQVPPSIRVTNATVVQAGARNARRLTEVFGPESLADGVVPTLDLEPLQTVAGVVLGAENAPIPDVTLWARPKLNLNRSSFGGSGTSLRIARSNAAGRFELPRLPTDDPIELFAEAKGYAPLRTPLEDLEREAEPSAFRQSRVVRLLPGLRAFGWVVDEGGNPVAGARVTLRSAMAGGSDLQAMLERAMADDTIEAWSDDQGRFSFSDLESGAYDLRAEAGTFAPAIVPAVQLPAVAEGAVPAPFEIGTVTLSPGVELTGFTRSPDGEPVEGVEIRVNEETQSMVMLAVTGQDRDGQPDAVSAKDGGFVIGGLAEGRPLTLTAMRDGYADANLSGVRPPSTDPLVVELEPAVTLTGRVVDPGGDGVAASVLLRAAQGGGARGGSALSIRSMIRDGQSSADDGYFEIRDVPPGTWDLTVTATGFQVAERNGLELVLGDNEELEIRLDRGATLRGRVLAADGSPADGATVQRVRQQRSPFDFSRSSRPARSSADGRYTLDGLPTGRFSISVEHPQHQKLVRDVEILPGDNTLDFRLEAGYEISGRVVDETGLAVAGAEVRATQPSGGFAITIGGLGGAGGAVSRDDGSFILQGLSNGTYRITANKEGFATATSERPVEIEGGSASGLLLTLRTGASISGQVSGLPFDDLPAVQVMAIQPGGGTMPRMAAVDYEGNYRLDNLGNGDWMVMATMQGGGRSVRESVTLDPGVVEFALDLEFGGGWKLSGQVLRGGEPVSGYQIFATGRSTTSSANTSTDQDGRFVLEGLETDVHDLVATNLRGSSHQQEIEVTNDQEITIEIRELTVSGRVTDAAEGIALSDAELNIESLDQQRLAAFRLGTAPRSAEDGRFQIRGVAPGSYRVSAALDGYATSGTVIEVSEFDVEGVEIQLERSSGLVLTVLHPSGGGVLQAQVAALDANGSAVLQRTVNAGERGRIELSDLAAGSWTLLVSAAGSATWEGHVEVPSPPQTVVLPRAGDLRVTVPELRGSGQLATLVLRSPSGDPYRSLSGFLGVQTEHQLLDGVAQLQSIRPGTWILEVSEPGSGAVLATGSVQVVPDTSVEAVLD